MRRRVAGVLRFVALAMLLGQTVVFQVACTGGQIRQSSIARPRVTQGLPSVADRERRERLARISVPFVENRGQLPDSVAFATSAFFGAVFVTREGEIIYSFPETRESRSTQAHASKWSITETLVSGISKATSGTRSTTGVSYFLGNDPRLWQQNLPAYQEVRLGEPWQGISVSLLAYGGNVEKIFTLAPGARVESIRLRVDGVSCLRLDQDGTLVASTGNGDVSFTSPTAYQDFGGVRRPVSAAYVLDGDTYGFRLGNYDRSLPLLLDPLLQSTYFGGSGGEEIRQSVAIDPSSGDVYAAGGPGICFVARFNSTLTTLLQVAYLDGNIQEEAFGVAVHPNTGEILVAGLTQSTDFPGTVGGAQPTKAGGLDGFVARLDSTLTTLLQTTYLGGSGDDYVYRGIAVQPTSGEILVAGSAPSTDFPGTAGGAQPLFGGGSQDGFVARFNPTLTTLLQATYLGGSGIDAPDGITVHPSSGEILVSGWTQSTDLPGTAGGAQPTKAAGQDGFVARLDPTLTSLLQATYFGGNCNDLSSGIMVHATSGEIYVTGWTCSPNLPGATGGAQPTLAGGVWADAFLARFNATLTTLMQSTYLGGSSVDAGYAVAINATSGEVLVAGVTSSTDFPGRTSGVQPVFGGGTQDAFISRLNSALTTLLQSTYLGDTGDDEAVWGIVVDPASGDVLVSGYTQSDDFPGTAGGAQPMFGGGFDGFVARLTADLTAITISDPMSQTVCSGSSVVFSVSAFGWPPLTYQWRKNESNLADGGAISGSTTNTLTINPSATGDSGSYDIVVTDGFSQTTTSNQASLTVNQTPVASASGPATICEGSSTPLSGSGGASCSWFPATGLSDASSCSPEASPSATTTYTLAVTSANGCPSTNNPTVTVTVNPVPAQPVITAPLWVPVDASGASASVANHPGSSWAWTLTGGTITAGQGARQIVFNAGPPGTTMLCTVVESAAGCSSPMASTLVQVDFLDVPPSNPFHDYVDTIARNGVTAGCGGGNYCGTSPITRAQMAVFLLRGKYGSGHVPPPATGTVFADVPVGSFAAEWIEELAAFGITGGCGGGNYCPYDPVTRAQMAVFLLKASIDSAYVPPPATGTIFADVAATDFAAGWIEDLYARGISGGCATNPLRYCPSNANNRQQMAVFIVKSFNLQ